MFSPMHVRRGEITIATLLRNSGYTTCHVGKWHLNGMFNLPELADQAQKRLVQFTGVQTVGSDLRILARIVNQAD